MTKKDTDPRTWIAGHALQDTLCRTDRKTRITGQGSQDRDRRTEIAGHGSQDMDCRKWIAGHGSQDMDSRTWIAGHGQQDMDRRTGYFHRFHLRIWREKC